MGEKSSRADAAPRALFLLLPYTNGERSQTQTQTHSSSPLSQAHRVSVPHPVATSLTLFPAVGKEREKPPQQLSAAPWQLQVRTRRRRQESSDRPATSSRRSQRKGRLGSLRLWANRREPETKAGEAFLGPVRRKSCCKFERCAGWVARGRRGSSSAPLGRFRKGWKRAARGAVVL